MSKLQKFTLSGQADGEIDWPVELLETERGAQAVHDAVVNTMNRRRAGTASTLRKGEVAGSNRKPWRQKGTGRARAGYRQSPVWRGGGIAFGPHPRSYGGKINKKVARLAFRRAVSERVASGQMIVIESLAVVEPKTKAFAAIVAALKLERGALFVTERIERNLKLAARNLPGVCLANAQDVGTLDVMRFPVLVVTAGALELLKKRMNEGAEDVQ